MTGVRGAVVYVRLMWIFILQNIGQNLQACHFYQLANAAEVRGMVTESHVIDRLHGMPHFPGIRPGTIGYGSAVGQAKLTKLFFVF